MAAEGIDRDRSKRVRDPPWRSPATQAVAGRFERVEPTVYDEPGTYVATDVEFQHNLSHEWNHGIGETITALLDHGMSVTTFVEHDTVPWDARPGQMEADARGEWRLIDRPRRLPCSFTLAALKRE